MIYIMPFIASIMSFFGIDSKKSVHFEDSTNGGEQMNELVAAPLMAVESA